MKKSKALVVQSGGPTAVINQSLAGLVQSCKELSLFDGVIGAFHGLHGVLHENLIDLTRIGAEQWNTLALCPGAALGSARLKPKAEDFDRIFQIIESHNIGYLFYIGGNDSAEAAQLVRMHANTRKSTLHVLHIPKTIDNDLEVTDHCPGFASAAQVVAQLAAGDDLDNKSFYNGIKINIAMGRHTGWLAAASAAARFAFPEHERDTAGPQLVYFPEVEFNETQFLNDVQRVYDRVGRATITVSEGIADQFAKKFVGSDKDEFGNPLFNGSGQLGDALVHLVEKNLKVDTRLGKLRARADTWGYMQRSIHGLASSIDQREAFQLGATAARFAAEGITDKMLCLKRRATKNYECTVELCDLSLVAQKTRHLPREFVNAEANNVTPQFFEYLAPLIDPVPRVETISASFLPRKLPAFSRH